MKAYLTSLSRFLLSSFIHICLSLSLFFSWHHISLTILSFLVYLQTVSCSLVFSHGHSTDKIVTQFLSFCWQHFNLPIWAGLGRPFTLSITDMSTCYVISWPTDLSDFSSLQIRPSHCFVSPAFLGQSVFNFQIGRLLLGAACQFIHPY